MLFASSPDHAFEKFIPSPVFIRAVVEIPKTNKFWIHSVPTFAPRTAVTRIWNNIRVIMKQVAYENWYQ